MNVPWMAAVVALVLAGGAAIGSTEPDFGAWPVLPESFPSTGGDGWTIGEYRPQVIHDRCVTAFVAISPEGQVFRNIVVFTAAPAQGGVLCRAGVWAAADRSASGTTPLVVFIRDGIVRGIAPNR